MKIYKAFKWGSKILAIFFILSGNTLNSQTVDRSLQQADSVLKLLNLEDCINLISGCEGMQSPGIPRLGIPPLKMTDGPYGPHWGKAPGFPVGVCLSATWDTSLIYQAARLMGKCTYAQGRNTLLGPCVNIHRMPTGGRNFESYSEDPWLASRMAVAVVKGLQDEHVIPTVKHYALNNNEWNRHLTDVQVDERTLHEIYLPAFEAAVKEANALAIMTSYNKIRGVHASENEYLINKILRETWGFKGIVVSDWASVYSTVGPVTAGLDIEMPSPVFFHRDSIMKYLETGHITREQLFEKARRNLYVRFAAGLFSKIPVDKTIQKSESTNRFIRTLAESGITLLKNEENILPLNRNKIKSIAVIGPNASVLRSAGGGSSYIDPIYSISPLEGIRNVAGNDVDVRYAIADSLSYEMIHPVENSFLLQPDGKTQGLAAEYFGNATLSGKPSYTCIDSLINFTWRDQSPAPGISRNTYSARWNGYLVPKISGWYILKFQTNNDGMVYLDDKPVIDRIGRQDATPIMMRQYLEAGRRYALRVEIFVTRSGGKAIFGWIPPIKSNLNTAKINEAVELARKSDVALICVGWDKMFETEGYDKEEGITLPGFQEELINAVSAVNSNTVVIINSGTPVFMNHWESKVKGLILAYYPGHEGGNALASILFGDVNPSGKLPFTFIADSAQAPAFKNYMNVSPKINYEEGLYIGYRFTDKNKLTPRFPFGHGLSYTSFAITKASVSNTANNTFMVKVTIKNTGKITGKEVVQVYVSDQNPGLDKPIKELKAFAKVSLQPGETKEVCMMLPPRAFMYYSSAKKQWVTEPGKYEVLIGNSATNIQKKLKVNIK
ncbi:MAG: glycoside hydrolase family 3 C-terminal domain-containing protein [Bacteroidales bacterium]|nr:glycoside hydrolase family 3 C-terminal domain-containing protein [Bacteroidales bacterium]